MRPKSKTLVLLVSFVFVGILSYRLAFSKPLTVKKNVSQLEREAVGFDNILSLNQTLKAKERVIDSILEENNLTNTSIQNNLLDMLNRAAAENNFSISEFNEPHRARSNGTNIISFQFTLRGSFKDIQVVLYGLEQEYSFGQVNHVSFKRKKDYRKGTTYLECEVIVQNIQSD